MHNKTNRLKSGMIILKSKRGFIRTIELNTSLYLCPGACFYGLISEKNRKKKKMSGDKLHDCK